MNYYIVIPAHNEEAFIFDPTIFDFRPIYLQK
jgi:hypothetical protein